MNSSNYASPAIGALILVPILIAASAASIALKASDYSQAFARFVRNYWHSHAPRFGSSVLASRRKLRRSNFHSSQLHSDLWYDLDSVYSDQEIGYSGFTGKEVSVSAQRNKGNSTSESHDPWHPFHTEQSEWSFMKSKSQHQDHCELQNVARPSATARRPTRLSVGDAALLARPVRVREARRWNTSGL
ncbi:hypothetical protein K3495_g9722 [Podosphaera aphanis]|nr:hypothetical protein K3495_g9722 [Podosphaera aphanis]